MLQIGSILMSSLLLFCMVAAPAELKSKEEPIYYQETTSYGDVLMASGTSSITIPYTSRTITKTYALAPKYPTYEYSPATNACAAIAAGNVIGFYDRYDENLIPNHTSGTLLGSAYIYSNEDSAVDAVIDQLYEYMGANSAGFTEDEFISGLTKFCRSKGKTITFSSCMKSGSFSYSTAQSYMLSNQPVVLFLSGYNVGELLEYENSDKFAFHISEANHIMVGFGYKVYTYSTSSGTATYEYINVASGLVVQNSGLYNINYQTKINDALAINIS